MSMKAKRRSKDEQLQLITKCRKSGLSDYTWCNQNNIKINTFYTWIRRLCKAGYTIPLSDPIAMKPQTQEVVKIDLMLPETQEYIPPASQQNVCIPDKVEQYNVCIPSEDAQQNTCDAGPISQVVAPTMELTIGSATLRLSNAADKGLLRMILQTLGGMSHVR